MEIGKLVLENNVFLAPMAGITDLPFRVICKENGAGLVYSEMVSAKGLLYDNKNTKTLLKIDKKEKPIAVQLFGRDPKSLSEITKKIDSIDFALVDINMGCPAPKIVKNFEGSALMKEPKLVGEIVKAVSKATKKPITIKIRKGFDDKNINAVEIAKIAEENGANAITVHGRTREEYYAGHSDWEIIYKVKQAVSIPIIGSGDIKTPYDAKKMLDDTGCNAIMIGRATRGNPFIFKYINHYLKTGEIFEEVSLKERVETAKKHCKMLVEHKGEYIGIREMRKHVSFYTKGIKNSTAIRDKINITKTIEEMFLILDKLL